MRGVSIVKEFCFVAKSQRKDAMGSTPPTCVSSIIQSVTLIIYSAAADSIPLLDLADDLARASEALDHLLALFPPADGVVALLEQVVQLVIAVHVLEQLALHSVLGEPRDGVNGIKDGSCSVRDTYCTSVYMTAFGTMSIIVRFTILKYEVMRSSAQGIS